MPEEEPEEPSSPQEAPIVVDVDDLAPVLGTETSELTDKQKKKLMDRKFAFEEIISSEMVYFKNLQFVYWSIICALQREVEKNTGLVSPQELQTIFSNWASLMNFNKELVKSFERRRADPIETRMIGDTFLERTMVPRITGRLGDTAPGCC